MKLKSTNLARGVFAWFCFLLCALSIIAGLIFAIYYGRSIFDEGSYFFTEIGQALSGEYSIPWLPSDFKKKNGYKRSIELSAEYELYRQNYCGCAFSKAEREAQIINA